jgi:membrane protein implicated in regulation of membrane protease activity
MEIVAQFYELHPLWTWLIIGAVLLTVEITTNTGWLLWPAACAAVIGLVAMVTRALGLPGEIVLFALLSIASSLTARFYLKRKDGAAPEENINDRAVTLIGKTGQVTDAKAGHVRVLVEGAEWEAEGKDLKAGATVKVVEVLGGARLAVEAV